MIRRKWLVSAGGAALVLVVGAGAVMAQATPPSGGGTSFLDRVAQKLGIESPRLQQAITDVRNQDIDAAVARGDLTQAQADKLKQQAAAHPGFGEGGPGEFGFGFGFRGGPGPMMGGLPGFGPGNGAEQQLADFLGIPLSQLATELMANNATLASVAQAHGKSADDLKGFITSTVKARLDQEVQNQNLTQKMEDQALSTLSSNLDKLINNPRPSFGRGGPHGFPGRGPKHNGSGISPSATPAAQSGRSSNSTAPF